MLTIVLNCRLTARFWHPWLGLVFVPSTLWMYKLWRNDMRITAEDRLWAKVIKYYIRNEDEELPPAGRFNYGQKLFFWLMFYRAILLLLSGLILWFPERIPWNMHWLRGARDSRTGDHRRLHHSCVHGNGHGPGRIHVHHPG